MKMSNLTRKEFFRLMVGCLVMVVVLSSALISSAGVMFKGKPKMIKEWKVEVMKLLWGKAGETSGKHRLMGSARVLLDNPQEAPKPITLVLDFKDATNGVVTTKSFIAQIPTVRKDAKGAKQEGKIWYSFEFAIDFVPIEGVERITLMDVEYSGESVAYSVFFNVNATILRERMVLPKSNVTPSVEK